MNHESNFMGRDGFCWFTGVCEDRNDPMKVGRVRIRVLGWHTENKSLIPTDELHWAWVAQGTGSQAMNGLGFSPTGIAEGTWVWGYFRDGFGQEPMVLGTLGGIPTDQPNPSVGFNDPGDPFHKLNEAPRKINYRYYPNDGSGAQLRNEEQAQLYPRVKHPWGCTVGEPDTNRLARGENLDDTILGVKKRQRDTSIPIAFSHPGPTRQWNEPESPADPKYPNNHMYESESGHVVELDDTRDNERIHIYHRSGTFIEIYGNPGREGDLVVKVVGKQYQVVMENSYQHYQNACNITIDGECNIYGRSDVNLQVDGNLSVHVQGDKIERIKGNYLQHVEGDRQIVCGGDNVKHVGHDHQVLVGGNASQHAGGNTSIATGSSLSGSAGGPIDLDAGGDINESAPNVHMNTRGARITPPVPPSAPQIPAFPGRLQRLETVMESGTQPSPEQK